jgi:hypothetical protein
LSEYESLDLPQLMQKMHDVAVPAAIPFTPQTAGWWILAGLVLAMVMLLSWRIVRSRRRNQYRREALAALLAIETNTRQNPAATGAQIALLLKHTALAAYPRKQVASLHGSQWAQFLCQTANQDPEIEALADQLASAAYRKDIEAARLIAPARRWIEGHHV